MKPMGAILALTLAALALASKQPLSAQTGFSGPYPVVMDAVSTLPEHTIYRPADLSKIHRKLPLVAYGNGACAFNGTIEESMLAQWASYGFVVTVPGYVMRHGLRQQVPPGGIPAQAAPETRENGPAPRPNVEPHGSPAAAPAGSGPGGTGRGRLRRPRFRQSKPDQMITVMNWAQAENGHAGSEFRGKLDLHHIAVVGSSCGGLEAISAAVDPRVTTLVAISSGIIRPQGPGGARGPGGMSMPGTVSDLQRLHTR